jgi:p-hydroxybenzoate 3-monooxygenase
MRTQIGIIGAGPAGLLLAHLLARHGIDSVIVENRSREYVEARIRAGMLEQGTVDLLIDSGVGRRLEDDGIRHDGIYLQWPGTRHHVNFRELCGRSVWIYGQTQLVRDLIAARLSDGQHIFFNVSHTSLHDLDTTRPCIRVVTATGAQETIECDIIAGCDGFHGPSRDRVTGLRSWQRDYPYAWLGILADVEPSTDELIYAWHPRGFALHSMRSPSVSRLYLQVQHDDDLANWPDDRIWEELSTRFALDGWELKAGPIVDKSITPMRSFVSSPMRDGRLFLAGDASHIVPPTGAKGLNLAVADVKLLSDALIAFFKENSAELMDRYSDTALRRVWRCTHFSSWMTAMLHVRGDDEFDRELQLSQLRYVCNSRAAAESLAENYTGMPFGW